MFFFIVFFNKFVFIMNLINMFFIIDGFYGKMFGISGISFGWLYSIIIRIDEFKVIMVIVCLDFVCWSI